MRIVFTTLLWVILILLAVAVAIFLLSLGFVGGEEERCKRAQTGRLWDATTPAPAAAARSTSTVMEGRSEARCSPGLISFG
jgi:hypothetical protein